MENIIFGKNVILEYLKTDKIDKIYLSSNFSDETVLLKVKQSRLLYSFVPRSKLDELSEQGNHQGVVAIVTPHQYVSIDTMVKKALSLNEQPRIIILDSVQDPHNLGAIIRTAECFGFHGIIIPKHRAASVNQTVIKVSTGAINNVLIGKVTNIQSAIKLLKKDYQF